MSYNIIRFRAIMSFLIGFISLYGLLQLSEAQGYTYFYAYGWWYVIIAPPLLLAATVYGLIAAGYYKHALDNQ